MPSHTSFRTLLAGSVLAAAIASPASADTVTSTFEPPFWTAGSPHLQRGWVAEGAAPGGSMLDHQIAATSSFPGAPSSFGRQVLRISNAVISGGFGNQTYSVETPNEAGETNAGSNGMSGGTRQSKFEAAFTVTSASPGAQQPGLGVTISPDRGDGARMAWVRLEDGPGGLNVLAQDPLPDGSFPAATTVAGNLDRATPHTVRIKIAFNDGPSNDVLEIWVDGTLRHTGTTWENYFNFAEGNPSRTVDSLLFRTSGAAAPASAGQGFLFDNVTLSTPSTIPSPPGPAGADGANGSNGVDGSDGADGAAGAQGVAGPQGASGGGTAFISDNAPSPVKLTAIKLAKRPAGRTRLSVRVSCPKIAGACDGFVRFRTPKGIHLGRATFDLDGGRATTVSVLVQGTTARKLGAERSRFRIRASSRNQAGVLSRTSVSR